MSNDSGDVDGKRKAELKAERKAARKAERKSELKDSRKAARKAAKEDVIPAGPESSTSGATPSPAPSASAVSSAAAGATDGKGGASPPGRCMGTFDAAPFAPAVLKILKANYSVPTEIQAQAWPVALDGSDLIAIAKTGSGKTLAFILPLLHRLSGTRAPVGAVQALVLSPTRELAIQIAAEAVRFGEVLRIASACVYGGTPLQAQRKELAQKRPALLVATPGRLCDLLKQEVISLGSCGALTLDEADRMLDMGFEPQLKEINAKLPTARQTLLFSATWPKSVRKLSEAYVRGGEHTVQIFVGDAEDNGELSANTAVSQNFIHATDDEKDNKLWGELGQLAEGSRVIVFANTKRRVENLAKTFYDFGTCAVHGDKQQHEREKALNSFIKNELPLMVATDVAARGLDIKGVTHVINYDMAKDVESYVHRIGRTGRAGETGISITFWNPDYDKECAPALIKIARDAGQAVPEWLAKHEKAKANKAWSVAKATLTTGA